MSKLYIFCCQKFAYEFEKIINKKEYKDIVIRPYKNLCNRKVKNEEINIDFSLNEDDFAYFICGKECDVNSINHNSENIKKIIVDNCYNHFANEEFIKYINDKKGYIVNGLFLSKWEKEILNKGLTKENAKTYYANLYQEIVFFNNKEEDNIENKLKAFSSFLELPYKIISFCNDKLSLVLDDLILKWKEDIKTKENIFELRELQKRNAQYALIFDILGKTGKLKSKSEVIQKVKEIFMITMGAVDFRYYSAEAIIKNNLKVVSSFYKSTKKYIKNTNEKNFLIKVENEEIIYGVIEAGNFMFFKHIDQYLNFSIDIANICALAITNIIRYEELNTYKTELEYKSFHDSLTGLYNRTYFTEIIGKENRPEKITVFSFDVDGLKDVNDAYGHLEGDKRLLFAAKVLSNSFRDTDTLARVGGDEFICIVEGSSIKMINTILENIEQNIINTNKKITNDELKVYISKGYIVSNDPKENIELIIKKADFLMYEDKKINKTLRAKKNSNMCK